MAIPGGPGAIPAGEPGMGERLPVRQFYDPYAIKDPYAETFLVGTPGGLYNQFITKSQRVQVPQPQPGTLYTW